MLNFFFSHVLPESLWQRWTESFSTSISSMQLEIVVEKEEEMNKLVCVSFIYQVSPNSQHCASLSCKPVICILTVAKHLLELEHCQYSYKSILWQ